MNLNLYKRYIEGQEIQVWNEIHESNTQEKLGLNWTDATLVLEETIKRIKHNINILSSNLLNSEFKIFYSSNQFKSTAEYDSILLARLKNNIKDFGYMPLSLEYLYKNINQINFLLTPSNNQPRPFLYSDPLFIDSLENVLANMEDGSWAENMEENEDEGLDLYIEVSPDYYHKDNISGGEPYGIQLTKDLQIDTEIVNTPYGAIHFIDYLRMSFNYAGFPYIYKYNSNFEDKINKLKIGLLNF